MESFSLDEKPENSTKQLDGFKTKQVKVEKERQEALQKVFDNFFTGLEKMLEATTLFQNNSLLHMVLKTEVEVNISTKADLNKGMTTL